MKTIRKTIVLLPGDGIGPEVTGAAAAVLDDCAREFGHRFEMTEQAIGGAAIDQCGEPLPAATLEACLGADAVLLGAVGGPRWDGRGVGRRPESGLLELRRSLEAYINLRPVRLRPALAEISPLRAERIAHVDFEIVRELAGGMYFGRRGRQGKNGEESAFDTESYSAAEIERVARFAFGRAMGRRRRLASIDKANVLESSALWRRTVERVAADYPRVEVRHLYVDNAAMQIVLDPGQFDVILTSNLFGDILSDEGAALAGSIGMFPSASLGAGPGLYEPIHGSAPQLAGKDCACPLGAILSAAMMLRESFGLMMEAEWIEAGVDRALERGYRTADIASRGSEVVGLGAMTEAVRHELAQSLQEVEGYGWGV
ncbi:MAG TPA: 3-isopropylmalate dehydrogenase [Candidatus Acidoferrales bacterium]|nr:3-isopropylmalate dehydrogenase [Candidatus Acidoferrales bacterium]